MLKKFGTVCPKHCPKQCPKCCPKCRPEILPEIPGDEKCNKTNGFLRQSHFGGVRSSRRKKFGQGPGNSCLHGLKSRSRTTLNFSKKIGKNFGQQFRARFRDGDPEIIHRTPTTNNKICFVASNRNKTIKAIKIETYAEVVNSRKSKIETHYYRFTCFVPHILCN